MLDSSSYWTEIPAVLTSKAPAALIFCYYISLIPEWHINAPNSNSKSIRQSLHCSNGAHGSKQQSPLSFLQPHQSRTATNTTQASKGTMSIVSSKYINQHSVRSQQLHLNQHSCSLSEPTIVFLT